MERIHPLLYDKRIKMPDNVLDFVLAIEETHPGLGIYALYCQTLEIAKESLILLGLPGTGKGAAFSCIYPVHGNEIEEWNTFTYEEMYHKWKGGKHNEHITMLIEDIGTFHQYHLDCFASVVPVIITQHKFYHKGQGTAEINVQNCTLTAFVGIQPVKERNLRKHESSWVTGAKDRFWNAVLIAPLRGDTYTKDYPSFSESERIEPLTTDVGKIPIKCDITPLINFTKRLFSGTRGIGHTQEFLRGTASMLHRKKVDEKVLKFFCSWLLPLVVLYDSFTLKKHAGGVIALRGSSMTIFQIIANEGKKGITIDDIIYNEKLPDNIKTVNTLYKRISSLKKMGLVRNVKRSQNKKYARYKLTGFFEDFFFKRYRGLYE